MPVHDGHKVHKPAVHWEVGYVSRPDLIGAIDGQIPKQIGINFVLGMGTGSTWFRVYRRDSHQAHQPLDPLSADDDTLALWLPFDGATSGRRILKLQFIDLSHQIERFWFNGLWAVIVG